MRGTKILHQFNTFRSLFDIMIYKSKAFFVYEGGDFDLFEVINMAGVTLRRASTQIN